MSKAEIKEYKYRKKKKTINKELERMKTSYPSGKFSSDKYGFTVYCI